MEQSGGDDSSGEHQPEKGDWAENSYVATIVQYVCPLAVQLIWIAKDGWKGREEHKLKQQRMFALKADDYEMWLEGYLFDETMHEPKEWKDALVPRTWVPREQKPGSCLVYRRISIAEDQCIVKLESEEAPQEVTPEIAAFLSASSFEKGFFYRVRGDRVVEYGDGGMSCLFYPLVTTPALALSPGRRMALRDDLLRVALASVDCHGDAKHIHDIIDPDLNPLMLEDWMSQRRTELKALDYYDDRSRDARHELRTMDTSIWDPLKLRKSYRWIPSDFIVRCDGSVNIRSPINGLPPSKENKNLYQNLAQVFRCMVPMFQEVGLKLLPNKDTPLQVVVKAQQYVMPPGSSYSGKWHKEGLDEDIAWAGVYYVDVEEGLEGGDLKFRPQEPPDYFYLDGMIDPSVLIPTKTGVCAVFCNVLPHRFRRIINRSDKPLRRLFINFFVFNPATRAMTAEPRVAGRMDVVWALRQVCPALPKDILKYILTMIPNLWPSMKEARRFRDEAKKAMASRKVGWGYVSWGNCGTFRYMIDRDCDRVNHMVGRDEFRHSDSGASDTVDQGN